MRSLPLVPENDVVSSIALLKTRPASQWPTVWPFAILYAAATYALVDPVAVWGDATYARYVEYIDFAHAVSIPVVFFFHAFASLLTLWVVPYRAFMLFSSVQPDVPVAAAVEMCRRRDTVHAVAVAQRHGSHGGEAERDGESETASALLRWDPAHIPAIQTAIRNTTHVMIRTHSHRGAGEIVPLHVDDTTGEVSFVFQQSSWRFDPRRALFDTPHYPDHLPFAAYRSIVADSPSGATCVTTSAKNAVLSFLLSSGTASGAVPSCISQITAATTTKMSFISSNLVEYSRKGFFRGGLFNADVDIQGAKHFYGHNTMDVAIPNFKDLMMEHMVAPFFVFQMFCVFLWLLDDYWMVALFNGVMMMTLEGTVVMQRLQSLKTMRQMATVPVVPVQVLRRGIWEELPSTDLLPGDAVRLPSNKPAPADVVVVAGTVVCNEAMLTGESTPQMKDPIPDGTVVQDKQVLQPDGQHGRHMVFAGTQILASSAPLCSDEAGGLSELMGRGAVGVVVRTGFATKQGQLIRTIIHSQSRVSENSGESMGFILVLLVFACLASYYVLQRGLVDPTKSRWKLFLTCTQIITNVVPPELPMELSLAVNTSLMALVKLRVFCTEPFRIPFAGKTDTCCFDKTGTLTTDEMLFAGVDPCTLESAVAVREADAAEFTEIHQRQTDAANPETLRKMKAERDNKFKGMKGAERKVAEAAADKAESQARAMVAAARLRAGLLIGPQCVPQAAERILVGCHSLVALDDGSFAGDAMEKAAVDALGWNCASADRVERESTKGLPPTAGDAVVHIHRRFPFDPSLRRMSCVVQPTKTRGNAARPSSGQLVVVTKGSPDTILELCNKATCNDEIRMRVDAAVARHAGRGLRVIALASRSLTTAEAQSVHELSRESSEQSLDFAGLCVFECPLKKDAKATIEALTEGSHRCAMITGDNLATAAAVARDVGILVHHAGAASAKDEAADAVLSAESARDIRAAVVAVDVTETNAAGPTVKWVQFSDYETYIHDNKSKSVSLLNAVPPGHDAFVSADRLSRPAFSSLTGPGSSEIERVSVWARCAPHDKEAVVAELKRRGRIVLMAGDGTNDVGGLKQAHVGIAVLNTALATGNDAKKPTKDEVEAAAAEAVQKAKTNDDGISRTSAQLAAMDDPPLPLAPAGMPRLNLPALPVLPSQPSPDDGIVALVKYQVALAKRKAVEGSRVKMIDAYKAAIERKGKADEDALAQLKELSAKAGGSTGADVSAQASAAMSSIFNDLDEEDSGGAHGAAPMVKLGDASIAAPFTCKSRRMLSVVDIVRLGRCALVTTLQMYKILALNCLVSAYTMAVLFSDGVKFGQTQTVAVGIVSTICFLFMSRSQPLERLSRERPITRVFHPYMVVSIAGQFAVHLYSLMQSVDLVRSADPDAINAQKGEDEEVDFRPTLLNSILFLMTTVMNTTTFAVNYKGAPFKTPLMKSKPLVISLSILTFLTLYTAFEIDPDFNDQFELVRFPSEALRYRFIGLLGFDVIGSVAVEKLSFMLLGWLP